MTIDAPIAVTTLTLALEKTGVLVLVLLAGAVLALPHDRVAPRTRAVMVASALGLTPLLLALALWNNPKLAPLHHHPLRGVAAILAVVSVVAVLAHLIDRHKQLLPLLAIVALPFRIPLGSVSSGLLIPLYAVIAAGGLVYVVRNWKEPAGAPGESDGWVRPPELALAAVVVAYGLQALYSPAPGVLKAVENVGFFYVPFATLFYLLRRLEWSGALLRRCLFVLLALAGVFVLVGLAELAAGSHLLLNRSLDQDAKFVRINSLFYDPNIYGRFLALTMILLSVAMLFERRPRRVLAAAAALALMGVGLLLSLSQSSMVALLAGLAVAALAAWGRRAAALAAALALVAVVVVVALALESGNSANFLTSGRASLVTRGVDMFKDRPLLGYGSGSFATEYLAQIPKQRDSFEQAQNLPLARPATTDSHTTPVTIAAEQGIVGLALYAILLIACFRELLGGDLFTRIGGAGWVARLAVGA
ncbi:MAG TPA: O-antigen ligase family protein, partial [Solirubrobacteraceae bacterium]|nr:O-antigen ligase family protein [Solirubrobacteraceae bacterium]